MEQEVTCEGDLFYVSDFGQPQSRHVPCADSSVQKLVILLL